MLNVPRVGEVLKAPNGLMRIVRDVHLGRSNPSITFVIRHCSWTHRPYTVYTLCDLRYMGYTSTHVVVKLDKLPQSRRIAAAIKDHRNRSLSCCDVRGCI